MKTRELTRLQLSIMKRSAISLGFLAIISFTFFSNRQTLFADTDGGMTFSSASKTQNQPEMDKLKTRQAEVIQKMNFRIHDIEFLHPEYIEKNQEGFEKLKASRTKLQASLESLKEGDSSAAFQQQADFFSDVSGVMQDGINFLQKNEKTKSPPIGTFLDKPGDQVRYPKEKKMTVGKKPFYEAQKMDPSDVVTNAIKSESEEEPKSESYMESLTEKSDKKMQSKLVSDIEKKSAVSPSAEQAESLTEKGASQNAAAAMSELKSDEEMASAQGSSADSGSAQSEASKSGSGGGGGSGAGNGGGGSDNGLAGESFQSNAGAGGEAGGGAAGGGRESGGKSAAASGSYQNSGTSETSSGAGEIGGGLGESGVSNAASEASSGESLGSSGSTLSAALEKKSLEQSKTRETKEKKISTQQNLWEANQSDWVRDTEQEPLMEEQEKAKPNLEAAEYKKDSKDTNETTGAIREWLLQEKMLIQDIKRFKPVKQLSQTNTPREFYILRQKQFLVQIKELRRRIEFLGKRDEYMMELGKLSEFGNRLLDLINRGDFTEYEAAGHAVDDLIKEVGISLPETESIQGTEYEYQSLGQEAYPKKYDSQVAQYFKTLSEG